MGQRAVVHGQRRDAVAGVALAPPKNGWWKFGQQSSADLRRGTDTSLDSLLRSGSSTAAREFHRYDLVWENGRQLQVSPQCLDIPGQR